MQMTELDQDWEVEVTYGAADEACDPPLPAEVRRILAAALPARSSVTVRFVSTRESQATNLRHLGKDRPANVLSFAYPDATLCGDVTICPAVVEREAAQAGIARELRYAHLLVHAALHLQGMAHAAPAAAAKMEATETKILATLGLPDPWQED